MKYYNYQITTSEIPGEITLCINLTNCPIHCADCHSKFLWEDVGVELTEEELYRILNESDGISCICFMGGDADYEGLHKLLEQVDKWKTSRSSTGGHPIESTRNSDCDRKNIKTALYSGRDNIQDLANRAGFWIENFDYIKVGPYVKFCGGLDHKTTNQRLFWISSLYSWCLATEKTEKGLKRICGEDITYKFWK